MKNGILYVALCFVLIGCQMSTGPNEERLRDGLLSYHQIGSGKQAIRAEILVARMKLGHWPVQLTEIFTNKSQIPVTHLNKDGSYVTTPLTQNDVSFRLVQDDGDAAWYAISTWGSEVEYAVVVIDPNNFSPPPLREENRKPIE